ncbi:MAG: acyl-CoA thioesterase [Thermoguttaceae bacterium]
MTKDNASQDNSAGSAVRKREAASVGYENEIQIRVRYQETDQMGVVYHANYFTYFEMGRTELLRSATGQSYRDVEERETFMVVSEASCKYLRPARYDDLLTLKTRVVKVTAASLQHEYNLYRGDELLVTGATKLVCVNKAGRIVPVPDWVRNFS